MEINFLDDYYDVHYNGLKKHSNIGKVKTTGWPKDRYEASVRWIENGTSILDIGCGHGVIANTIKEKFQSYEGLDISKVSVDFCNRVFKNNRHMNFRVVNVDQEFPYEDNSFDYILCTAVIEHVIDVYGLVKKMHRALKKGGKLFIDTPNIAKWTRRIKLLFGIYPATASKNEGLTLYSGKPSLVLDEGHLHNFTYRSLRKILEREGFKIYKKIGFGKLGFLHNIWPEVFSGDIAYIVEKV